MKKIILILLISLNIGSVGAQTPLGEEFTYQGELKDANGNPHNGVFDFKFIAYDAQLDGTGTNLGQFVAEDVTVTNGIFTTQIDYSILGDQPFVGNKVWLEISVRVGTSTGLFQTLLPRQQVTATPYANYSTFAEIVGNNAIGTLEIQDASITSADIGPNAVGLSAIDNTQVQQRINTVCSGGRVIKSVDATGVATCVFPTPNDNSVNSAKVTDGSIVAADVDTSQIQQRINGSCVFPEYVTSVAQDGSVVCVRMPLPTENILDSSPSFFNTSIAIGSDGNPMISYTGTDLITGGNTLNIVQCSNPYCTAFNLPVVLDSSPFLLDLYTSLAIGKTDGLPIISYWDGINSNLNVVKCGTRDCAITNPNLPNHNIITVLDGDTPAIDIGEYTSIALDSNDLPVISYLDRINGNLKVIKCSDTDCSESSGANTIRTLDSSGVNNVGFFTSIALDNNDIPIISYYDFTNNDLKVVRCFTSDCSSAGAPIVLDGGGVDVGRYTSIAIPKLGDNLPIISYYDFTNTRLKVLKCGVPDCSITTPGVTNANKISVLENGISIHAGDLGTSIVIGQDNNPIISYQDNTNDDLKVVKCQTQDCQSSYLPITLDSNGLVGRYSSIAIGDDGNPIISYIGLGLKVFSCGDARCIRGL